MSKIAILGCGHGGQALAAQLAYNGHDIALYAHPDHSTALEHIKLTHFIKLFGAFEAEVNIQFLTIDIQQAIEGREIIYISLPTFAHETTFLDMLPHLQDGQIIVTLASNFSSLAYLELQRRQGIKTQLIYVDIASLPYACRAEKPGLVNIYAIKNHMGVAVLPANKTTEIIDYLQTHFPTGLIQHQNILELGLNISSGISHPIVALMNAGRIGQGEKPFYFYKEGITPEIAGLLERIDKDRCEIGKRLGYKMTSYLDIMAGCYGNRYDTIYDFFTKTPVHNAAYLCPDSLNSRYITQDVPYLLVPWFNLGLMINYVSEPLQAVIHLASQLLQHDFMQHGRNQVRMGLQNKTLQQIHNDINKGLTFNHRSENPLKRAI